MNPERIKVLQALSAGQVNSASTLINRHFKRWGHYSGAEFTADLLDGMVNDGLLQRVERTKRHFVYSITSTGLQTLEVPVAQLQVVPPRERPFMEWDGRMQWGPESERGCHPNIGRVGVAC